MISTTANRRFSLLYFTVALIYPMAQANDSTNSLLGPTCPLYRAFDTTDPDSIQFSAPTGCACTEGMSGLDCAYCDSTAACGAENEEDVCSDSILWSPADTYKSFKCHLSGSLATLFTGGMAYYNANVTEGTAEMAVFNTKSINDIHAVNCYMTGCTFPVGGAGAKCALVDCRCTDQCNEFTRKLVENVMSGKPTEVIFDMDISPGQHKMNIDIEDSPFPLEAICNVSACTLDPEIYANRTALFQSKEVWNTPATFSLVVLIAAGAVIAVLCVGVFLPQLRSGRGNVTNKEQTTKFMAVEDPESNNGTQPKRQTLEFRDVDRTVTLTDNTTRRILCRVSGRAESGTVTAVMGPSGSGKTSLLNVLAAIDDDSSVTSGRVLYNGRRVSDGSFRDIVAHVPQYDALYDTLTVRECVEYSAMLRLPAGMGDQEKRERVSSTLEDLRLSHVTNSRISKISGGERKRVGIGMELVSQPSVLLLDEPTSGLDSHASNLILNILKELAASQNRIVLLSVHQPSAKAFNTFDKVLVLGSGHLLYNDKPSKVDVYFANQGYPRPQEAEYQCTVAEHMLDVVSNQAHVDILKLLPLTEYAESDVDDDHLLHNTTNNASRRSLRNELAVLFLRTSRDIFRNRELFLLQIAVSVVLAVFSGAIFNDVSDNLAGFQNRLGAFYFSLSFFAFASLGSMDIFVRERTIFVRETGARYYRAASYFLAKAVLDTVLLRVVPVTIFAFVLYFMMGLRDSPEAFLIFWATLVLFNVCAGILAIGVGVAMPTVGTANLLAVVWFLEMLLFGGFLINIDSMDGWFAWLKYTSIFYYSFENLVTNELTGLLLSFDVPGYPEVPVYGEVFLKTVGMHVDHQSRNLVCLCSLALGGATVACGLLVRRVPPDARTLFRRMEERHEELNRTKGTDKALDDDDII